MVHWLVISFLSSKPLCKCHHIYWCLSRSHKPHKVCLVANFNHFLPESVLRKVGGRAADNLVGILVWFQRHRCHKLTAVWLLCYICVTVVKSLMSCRRRRSRIVTVWLIDMFLHWLIEELYVLRQALRLNKIHQISVSPADHQLVMVGEFTCFYDA